MTIPELTATPLGPQEPAATSEVTPVLTIDIGGKPATAPEPPSPSPSPSSEAAVEEAIVSATVVEVASNSSTAAPATASANANAAPVDKLPVPSSILVVDVGGTKVKLLLNGETEPRKAPTGKDFTPAKLVETVRDLAGDWKYDALTIGYPGLVGPQGPRAEPGSLGAGWVGFDFAAAFGKPVKMINDAAMQALGSYEGGRMLFLGLGTGLGSTLIAGHVIIPMELGRLSFDGKMTLGEALGRQGLERLGKSAWREAVTRTVTTLMGAFVVDYIVIGGGNAKNVKELPPGARLGHNLTAFRGGVRIWSVDDVWVLAPAGGEPATAPPQDGVRVL